MSRIGKLKIKVPSGVEVSLSGQTVNVKGPKGALSMTVHPSIRVEMSDGAIMVTRTLNEKAERSLHGLTRSLLNNMVNGVTKGFEKKLGRRLSIHETDIRKISKEFYNNIVNGIMMEGAI